MKEIRMVDLKGQYKRIKSEIDTAIKEVIESTAFINGPVVKEFQNDLENYLGVKHVIPCGNGTDALQVAMMGLELKPGDEIITTTFTFIATAEVIALLKLTPVLVDVDPDTFNINPDEIRKAITHKTKAIVPVHLFGQCADMDEIMKIAKEHGLYVIEDACQAIGSEFIFENGERKKAGTIGDAAGVSFFPSKNLGCFGDGGAIFTNNDNFAKLMRSIVNHGMTIRYHHENIGVNSRLDSIQAAILNVKLKYLDKYIKARQEAANYYDKKFAGHQKLKIPFRVKNSTHVFHQYTLVVDDVDRDELQKFLASKNIPAMVYYPIPLHLQQAYKDPRYKEGNFPVSEYLSKHVISLPMHTELDEEQLGYITNTLLEFIK